MLELWIMYLTLFYFSFSFILFSIFYLFYFGFYFYYFELKQKIWYNIIYNSYIYYSVMECCGHEQFLFSFSFIFWLYRDFVFFFFFFSFEWWRGMWHCSHMTCHMMWCHRPRRWWKDLEDDVRAYVYNMATLRWTWGRSIDIRAGLIISSTDHEDFVYIGL